MKTVTLEVRPAGDAMAGFAQTWKRGKADTGERHSVTSGGNTDRYRIERELGVGGRATVILAHSLAVPERIRLSIRLWLNT